ncbi:hypothetical protein [Pseudoalteromonas sp.]|uniref:hypothetical protein n=1 Tax=Pseudoalteromonas sp. TaxID=53249 RepID=UPI00356B044E
MRIIGLVLFYILLPSVVILWFLRSEGSQSLTEIPYALPNGVTLKSAKMYHKHDKPLSFALTQSPRKIMLTFIAATKSKVAKHKPFDFKVALNITCRSDIISEKLSFSINKQNDVTIVDSDVLIPAAFLEKIDNETLQISDLRRLHYEIPENCSLVELDVLSKSDFIDFVGFQVYQHVIRSTRVAPIDVWQRLSETQKANLTESYPFDRSHLTKQEKANLAKFRWQPLIPEGNNSYKIINYFTVPREFTVEKAVMDKAYSHLSDVYKTVTMPIAQSGDYYLHAEHNLEQHNWQITMHHYNLNDNQTDKIIMSFNKPQVKHKLKLAPGLVTFNSSVPAYMAMYSDEVKLEEHEHFIPTYLVRPDKKIQFDVKHSTPSLTPLKVSIRSISNTETETELPNHAKIEIMNNDIVVDHEVIKLSTETDTYKQLSGYDFSQWLSLPAESFLELKRDITHIAISAPTNILVSAATRIPSKASYRYLPEQKRDWFDFDEAIPDWFAIQPNNFETFVETGSIQMLKVYHQPLSERYTISDKPEYHSLLKDNQRRNAKLVIEEAIIEQPILEQNSSITLKEHSPQLNEFFRLANNHHLNQQQQQNNQLFYIRQDNQPKAVSWSFNNQPQPPFYIAGRWGVIELTSILPKPIGLLSIDKGEEQWFINDSTNIRTPNKLVKKQIMSLPANTWQELKVTKQQARELLSFTVLSEEKQTNKRVVIDLEISATKHDKLLQKEATLEKMHYSLRMHPTDIAVKLSSNTTFNTKINFIYPLREDIDNKEFILKVKSSDKIYLAISQQRLANQEQIKRYRYDQDH